MIETLANILAMLKVGGEIDRESVVELFVEGGYVVQMDSNSDYRKPLKLTKPGLELAKKNTVDYEKMQLEDQD